MIKVAFLMAAITAANAVPTTQFFCGLAVDGSSIAPPVTRSSISPGSKVNFFYDKKEIFAYTYEVCGFYKGRLIQIDAGSKTASGNVAPKKPGKVYEVEVPDNNGFVENANPCSVDTDRNCEEILGEIILEVQFDLSATAAEASKDKRFLADYP